MTETLLRCDPYEDLDERIKELYMQPPPDRLSVRQIAEELGRSKTYVTNRIKALKRRREIIPRSESD